MLGGHAATSEAAIDTKGGAECSVPAREILQPADLATIYRLIAPVVPIKKSEWETTKDFEHRVWSAIDKVLRPTRFGCTELTVRLPLEWQYDADRGQARVSASPLAYEETQVALSDLEPASNTKTIIRRGGDALGTFEAPFEHSVGQENVASRQKTLREINDCLNRMSVGGLSAPLSIQSYWCRKKSWDVVLFLTDGSTTTLNELRSASDKRASDIQRDFPDSPISTRHLPAQEQLVAAVRREFPLALEEAKTLRTGGLYLFVTFELAPPYTQEFSYQNEWRIYGAVKNYYLGRADGSRIP